MKFISLFAILNIHWVQAASNYLPRSVALDASNLVSVVSKSEGMQHFFKLPVVDIRGMDPETALTKLLSEPNVPALIRAAKEHLMEFASLTKLGKEIKTILENAGRETEAVIKNIRGSYKVFSRGDYGLEMVQVTPHIDNVIYYGSDVAEEVLDASVRAKMTDKRVVLKRVPGMDAFVRERLRETKMTINKQVEVNRGYQQGYYNAVITSKGRLQLLKA